MQHHQDTLDTLDTTLYQAIILDHSKHPRNFGRLEAATVQAHEVNRLCGDSVTVFARLEGECVAELQFVGSACAVATASASLMTILVRGKSRQEIALLAEEFEQFLRTEHQASARLEELRAFEGVRHYATRIKCALLPWKALERGLVAPLPPTFPPSLP